MATLEEPDPQAAIDEAYDQGVVMGNAPVDPALLIEAPLIAPVGGGGMAEQQVVSDAAVVPAAAAAVDGPKSAALDGGEAGGVGGIGVLMWRVFVENKLALIGVGLIIFMLLFAFVGPHIYVTPQTDVLISTSNYLDPPSAAHLLGTDANGYDELGRLMLGGQSALEIALAAAGMATIFGVLYGAIAGFVGGVVDAVMMRVVDTLLSIPTLFMLVVLAAILSPNLILFMIIVGVVAWLVPARLVRGETLTLRTREYVQAVKGMGGSRRRIVLRHIIPNAIGTIVVNATFQVADAMLLIAALGFLGFGIQPPGTSWGQLLSDGVSYVESTPPEWWLFYPAGICIVLVVLGFNFVGDALRDALETKLQKR